MTTREHRKSILHAQNFLRELERVGSAGSEEVTHRELEQFEEMWGQIRQAHIWLTEHPGQDTDDLCAQYPMTSSQLWLVRLSAHERQARMAAAYDAAVRQRRPGVWGALAHHLAATHLELDDPAQAAVYYERALDVSRSDDAPTAEAQDREGLARAYLDLGLIQLAVHHLQRALTIVRAEADRAGEAMVLRTLARCHRKLNQLEIGHRYTQDAINIMIEVGNQADALATLAEWLGDLGEADLVQRLSSLDTAVRAAAQPRGFTNPDTRISILHDLARAYLRLNRPREALQLLEQAVAAVRQLNTTTSKELTLLGTLAEAAHAHGDDVCARSSAEERVRLADQLGDDRQQWAALHALGDLYRHLGDLDRAVATHGDALRVARESNPYLREENPRSITDVAPDENADFIFGMMATVNAYKSTLASLGHDHATRGDLEQAIPYWEQAADRSDTSADAFDAEVLSRLAMAYADTGRHEAAIACHERQLKIIRRREDRPAEADMLGEIANVYLGQRDWAKAIDLYQSAYVIDLQTGNDVDMTAVLANLAIAEWQADRPRRSGAYADRALALARESGQTRLFAAVKYNLAEITHARPERPAAIEPEPLRRAAALLAAGEERAAGAVLAAAAESPDRQVAAGAGLRLGRRMAVEDEGIARAAWMRAAEQGDRTYSPQAAAHLARLCDRQGGTIENWTTVSQTDGYAGAADAAARAGALLARDERFVEARAAFEKAIVLGSVDTARLLVDLGKVLIALGDPLGAREAFRSAGRHGTLPVCAAASLELADLLLEQGDQLGAIAAYEQAAAADDAQSSPLAYAALGRLALANGDRSAAEEAVRAAIASRHRLAAPAGSATLGTILQHRGERAAAHAAFEAGMASPDPVVAAEAAANLGGLLAEQGNLSGAEELWASIPMVGWDTGDSLVTWHLAGAMLRRGDRDGAGDIWRQRFGDRAAQAAMELSKTLKPPYANLALEQAIIIGDPAVLPSALDTLLSLLDDDEQFDRLRRAMDDGEPELTPLAAMRLGQLHAVHGDIEAARRVWEVAVASGHPEYAAHGMYEIGLSFFRAQELPVARDWYQRAVSAESSTVRPSAAVNLGGVLASLGDLEGAETAFGIAIASDNREQAGWGWVNLGVLRSKAGDAEGAHQAWRQALGSGTQPTHRAMELLYAFREG